MTPRCFVVTAKQLAEAGSWSPSDLIDQFGHQSPSESTATTDDMNEAADDD